MDEYAWGGEIDGEDQSSIPPSSVMSPELAQYGMEQASAFDIITGVAVEYLQDIGRTLRLYLNNNDSRKKYSEEV